MPDMPQQAGPEGAPPEGGGGGISDALIQLDALTSKIAEAVAGNDQLPDNVKAAWETLVAAERDAITALTDAAEGGGAPPPPGGTTTVEEGGSAGAVPQTHQSMRGG